MAADDSDLFKSLSKANFAKTDNQYFLAWHEPDEITVLSPHKPESCDTLFGFGSIDEAVTYVESGEYAKDSKRVLNLFILNEETGEWE